MKRALLVLGVVLVLIAVLVSVGMAQQKKAFKFYTYDSTAPGKPACWTGDENNPINACTDITVSGVVSGGSVTYATAITSAPSYTGQMAVTGGHVYLATGTTGTTNWKQTDN